MSRKTRANAKTLRKSWRPTVPLAGKSLQDYRRGDAVDKNLHAGDAKAPSRLWRREILVRIRRRRSRELDHHHRAVGATVAGIAGLRELAVGGVEFGAVLRLDRRFDRLHRLLGDAKQLGDRESAIAR